MVKLSASGLRYLDRYLRRLTPCPNTTAGRQTRTRSTRPGDYQIVRESLERAGVKGTIGAHDLRTPASHVVGRDVRVAR